MAKLFLQRHLKSQWNIDDRFAGWTDGPLAKDSSISAKDISWKISGLKIDKIYCSSQFRNLDTIAKIFENISETYPMFIHIDGGKMQNWGKFSGEGNYMPVYVTERLNERYYGELQGLLKQVTAQKYGEEKARLWRRSYNIAPPGGESLKDVFKRIAPFFKKNIEKDLKEGKNILIVASHNPLRAIIKYLENISDEKIIDVELPFGALVEYDFDGKEYIKL